MKAPWMWCNACRAVVPAINDRCAVCGAYVGRIAKLKAAPTGATE